MIAGEVVQIPRSETYRCPGCRRCVNIGSTLALDLPDGSWIIICFSCYSSETVANWFNLPWLWNGERWLAKSQSIPLPNEREARSGD
jgi:hypothetical protein